VGRLRRAARGHRTWGCAPPDAGISVETLRKIETGRIPTPAFFTIAALCQVLDLSLDDLARTLPDANPSTALAS
jgi:transcriptional regulator with XRE-family HTH domain